MNASAGPRRLDAAGPASDLPLIGQLLVHAANGTPLGPDNRNFAWRAEGANTRQFQWALEGGLGPLLHRASRGFADALPPAWREALLGAELTARVRQGNLVDVALEIIEVCERLKVCVTLLKGISVSEELYPAEHLRPMSDVDILIPASAYAPVEAALLEGGYDRIDYPAMEGHHHGAPLRHRTRRTLVELHTALFPSDSPLCENSLFSLPGVSSRSVRSMYHGKPVMRLSPELQLVYIASSWFNDLTLCKVHPSFLASLFDAVYLLAASGRTLRWNEMFEWLDNEMAIASLYAMLTYLPRYGVDPLSHADLMPLASAQRLMGSLQLRAIHRMLDRHLIGARPWPFELPPPVPGRYNIARQFRKRIASRFS
jgi:hypothetical protein